MKKLFVFVATAVSAIRANALVHLPTGIGANSSEA